VTIGERTVQTTLNTQRLNSEHYYTAGSEQSDRPLQTDRASREQRIFPVRKKLKIVSKYVVNSYGYFVDIDDYFYT